MNFDLAKRRFSPIPAAAAKPRLAVSFAVAGSERTAVAAGRDSVFAGPADWEGLAFPAAPFVGARVVKMVAEAAAIALAVGPEAGRLAVGAALLVVF
jgi:hypothetical protein